MRFKRAPMMACAHPRRRLTSRIAILGFASAMPWSCQPAYVRAFLYCASSPVALCLLFLVLEEAVFTSDDGGRKEGGKEVVFTRENRGESAQRATRATPRRRRAGGCLYY